MPILGEGAGTDPLADVVSWNLKRRHLSTSQKATLAVALKPMFEARARERMLAGKKPDPTANLRDGDRHSREASHQAAAAVGVSGRIVQDAEHVKRHAPEVFEEVKAGRMTVHAAVQVSPPKRTLAAIAEGSSTLPAAAQIARASRRGPNRRTMPRSHTMPRPPATGAQGPRGRRR